MADHHIHTRTLPLHSHSPTSSLPSAEFEKIGENENDCQLVEDTVPFDDTMLVDSPLAETQVLELTSGDGEEEVVLDSEDEEFCRNKRVDNGLSYGDASNSQKREAASDERHCSVGNKRWEATGEQKDCPQLLNNEVAKLSSVGSLEPGRTSQDNALEFVDQFLSLNSMNLCSGIGATKTAKDVCSPVSGLKGPLILAKRLKGGSPVSATGIFEWAHGDQLVKDDVINRKMGACFQSERRCQKAKHLDCKEGYSISDDEHQEKEQVVDLSKKTGGSTQLDLRFVKHSPEETNGVCKMNRTSNSVKESNEDLHAESSEQQLNTGGQDRETTPDMYDVGFNTQIAAEAMEALLYGPSAGCVAFDACEGSSKTTEDLPKSVITGEAHLEHTSLQKNDCFNSGGITRKSKRGKRSARKYGKNSNNQKLDACDAELAMMTRVKGSKSPITEQFNQRKGNVSSGRKAPGVIVRRQVDKTMGGNNYSQNDMDSSISVDHVSLSKEQTGGQLKLTSVAQETMQSFTGGKSMRSGNHASSPAQMTEDGIIKYRRKRSKLAADTVRIVANHSGSPAQMTEDGIIKYRRKRSRLVADTVRIVGDRGRCSELHYSSSAESRDNNLGLNNQTCQDITATNCCLETDIWSHPKRKRTPCKMQRRPNGASNNSVSLAILGGSQSNNYCIESRRSTEHNDKTTCYSRDMKKRAKLVSSSLSQHSSENNLRQKFVKTNLEVVISSGESASMSRKIFPGGPDRLEAFIQSEKRDGIDCVLFGNGVAENHKVVVSSYKNVETPCSGHITSSNNIKGTKTVSSNDISSKYFKHPSNKNLPKSSLLKELVSLGAPASIPDFSWKELRRRRDTTCIKVLFSQHLDDEVIRLQKKISARLGISVATCSMDATHFIADRFVRTRNMLEAIALAKPVVTPLWLESCGQASCLIDEKNYILRDAKREKEIGFSMPVSFDRASQRPLLKGRRVFITPNTQPHKEMITSLVKLVHGQVVERSQIPGLRNQEIQDDLVILSCEQDHAICVPFLNQGVAVYSSELLLNGIVIQRLEFERHQLFENQAKRNQPRTRFRKGGKNS